MSRIDLQVPFSEKDEAQRLGARWDPRQRVWYVPAGVDPAPLQQWCPRPPTPNIRSPRYFLATTTRDCWRCAASTRVVAIVLPEGHEAFYVGDDPADDCWQESGLPVVLSYVAYLTDPVAALLRSLAPHYRIDFSKTTARHPNLSSSHSSARHGGYFSMRTILKRCANALRDSW